MWFIRFFLSFFLLLTIIQFRMYNMLRTILFLLYNINNNKKNAVTNCENFVLLFKKKKNLATSLDY